MPILLSDEEYLDYLIEHELCGDFLNNNMQNRRAQLKKVVEWLLVDECEDNLHEHGYSGCEFFRWECKDCRESLKKEVGL